jgi:ribosomal protein L7Ae-like RNA K-turn-binding protein
LSERGLRLLGQGMRAGYLVLGTAGVRAGLQRGDVALVVVAANRSGRTGEKVERLARARGVPLLIGPPDEALGRRLGRGALQAVGVTDGRLAAGIAAHGWQQEV